MVVYSDVGNKEPIGVENFGKRLDIVLNGESVAAFARKCGISHETIKKYLKNETCPGIDKVLLISQHTGVSLSWLISGEGESYDSPFSDEDANRWWGIISEALNLEQKHQIIKAFRRTGVEGIFNKQLLVENKAWG